MNKNLKKYINLSIRILSVIAFLFNIWFLVTYILPCIKMYICLAYPSLTYKGDKSVSKEDVIYLEKLTIRDIRVAVNSKYDDGTTYYRKSYIVKRNHISKKKIYQLLSNYCKEYYAGHDNYNKVGFFFYGESGTMPWFWNNEGYFPDLEMNSENLICKCFVSKDGMELIEGGW